MTCRELIEQLIDYLDGTLPLEDFEHHLGLCPSCRAYVDSYLATIRLVFGVRQLERMKAEG